MPSTTCRRRLPIGAEFLGDEGTSFRVWAPASRGVEVVLEAANDGDMGLEPAFPLEPDGAGYFAGTVGAAHPGTRYRFRLDGGILLPDPASRFQPDGPFGASEVIDPGAFRWSDRSWRGVAGRGQVLYELHVGTFTPEGTWSAVARRLPELADLGVSVLEVMPVADFAGRFGWGYDGVDMFAPTRLYGRPDDFRRCVDRAHSLGMGVILDVVYNHFGSAGAVHVNYAADYITDRYDNEWGDAINFDGENSGPVREFFLTNVAYWIEEFHIDGFRIDATQQFFDASATHILKEIVRAARAAAGTRSVYLVAESEPQDAQLLRLPGAGGSGFNATWNDDFHHVTRIAAARRCEAYYSDYRGSAQEFVSLAKYGFLYQGQRNTRQAKRRGSPAFDIHPEAFINYLQNHDQIANSLRGDRLHRLTGPGMYRALTAFHLLGPGTPLLFQGQEFAASTPFVYFADNAGAAASATAASRAQFLSQFPSIEAAESKPVLHDPADPSRFTACKLNHDEREQPGHAEIHRLHKDLLDLRREDAVISGAARDRIDGAVLCSEGLVIRYFGRGGDDRILLLNLGCDLHLNPAPEPLLAPPSEAAWRVVWSSEHPSYGGCGTPAVEAEDNWHLPGHAAVLMAAAPVEVEERTDA